MYSLRTIFLALACSLFVLHHVVPHEHEPVAGNEVVTATTTPEHPNWLKLLSFVFLEDLGENHLEQLSVTDHGLDFCLHSVSIKVGLKKSPVGEIFAKPVSTFILSAPVWSGVLRAPPALTIA